MLLRLRPQNARKVFEAFLLGMTTYRPLLLRIKAAYDPVLRDATASVYDNAHIRGELARAPAELVRIDAPE